MADRAQATMTLVVDEGQPALFRVRRAHRIVLQYREIPLAPAAEDELREIGEKTKGSRLMKPGLGASCAQNRRLRARL